VLSKQHRAALRISTQVARRRVCRDDLLAIRVSSREKLFCPLANVGDRVLQQALLVNGADFSRGDRPGFHARQQFASPGRPAQQGVQYFRAQGRCVTFPAGQQCLAGLRVVDPFQPIQSGLLQWCRVLRLQNSPQSIGIRRRRARRAAQ